MNFKPMRLQIHFRFENYKLLVETFLLRTEVMIGFEVRLQRVVVDIILWLPALGSPVTDVTTLVLVPAVCVQLVITVEPLATEATLGMTSEAALVDRARVVVAEFLMLSQAVLREQFVLMSEDLLVPCAEIAASCQHDVSHEAQYTLLTT